MAEIRSPSQSERGQFQACAEAPEHVEGLDGGAHRHIWPSLYRSSVENVYAAIQPVPTKVLRSGAHVQRSP